MTKNKNYTELVEELEKILSELENDQEVNMEMISAKVKRAAEIIEICKKQLHEIDTELEKILSDLD